MGKVVEERYFGKYLNFGKQKFKWIMEEAKGFKEKEKEKKSK